MLDTMDEILDFAIKEEEKAADFYRSLGAKAEMPAMRQVFEDFAREEDGHKAKLLGVKRGNRALSSRDKVLDLKIVDYLVKVDPFSDELNYQQFLVVAMKKEKAAFLLYQTLADIAQDAGLRDLFLGLAQEEAKHKLRFEIEYDEYVLSED